MSTEAQRKEIPASQYYRQKEAAVFSKIKGMDILLNAAPDSAEQLRTQYPDAAFALMTADNLFTGDREQCDIHQKAYYAILKGESLKNIRYRYEREMEAYVQRHMWDD